MKLTLACLLMAFSFTTFAYTSWSEYSPKHILSDIPLSSNILRKNQVILYTKGMVNSAGALFEKDRYRVSVISCSQQTLELKMEHINNTNAEAAKAVATKLKVSLPKKCDFSTSVQLSVGQIIINGEVFDKH